MSTDLTLPAGQLAAAIGYVEPFAEDDDFHPAIHAVRFIPSDDQLVLAATNRYALAEYTLARPDQFIPAEHQVRDVTLTDAPWKAGAAFSLPRPAAREWLKRTKIKSRASRLASIRVADGMATLEVAGESHEVELIDHAWPNHERLFPAKPGAVAHGEIGLTAGVLLPFTKAFSKPVRGLRFAFGPTPLKPVTVTCDAVPEFRGLLMPCRLEDKRAGGGPT